MILPDETEAALRGRNHAEGYSGWLIEMMDGARRLRFCAPQKDHIGSVDPDALKIPARRAEY